MNKRFIYLSLLLTASYLIAACGSKRTTIESEEVIEVVSKYDNVSDEDLQQGQALYEKHCVSCHKLKTVEDYSVEAWEMIVPKMVIKANKKYPDSIDSLSEDLILKYVAVTTMNQ